MNWILDITRVKILDEVIQAFSGSRSDAEALVYELFPNERFYCVCVQSFSNFPMKTLA